MEDWKEYKLEEVCENIYSGGTPSTTSKEFWNGDLPWLSSGETGQNYIYSTEKTITQLGADNSSTRYAYKYSTVVASAGQGYTRGQASFLMIDTYVNQSVIVLKPNPKIIDSRFLYFNIDNRYAELRQLSDGTSTRGSLSGKIMKDLTINLPPLPTQQKIAQILSSLDDKIELNNKINANLEQQAQALFKSWFVDFEPFGGEMPARWKVGTIGDLCSTVSQTYKGNDSEVVLINTSDVENGDILNHESVANSNLKGQFKKTFQRNDILYSEIRPANRHYAFVDIDETGNYIASTKLMVIRPNENVNPHYLYHILTNPELIKEMQHLAETRSGTFPQITFESELSTYQIPLLPKEEQDKLGNLFEKIDNMVFHNIKENKKLSNLRETLLPKLMNGEIEI